LIEVTVDLLIIFFAVGMCAGFFDAISGGGGLLTVPALLIAGVPPLIALGTNKFQGIFGTASATLTFASKGHLDLRALWPIAASCFVASVLGAFVASYIPQHALSYALPVVLIWVALYFAFSPNLSDLTREPLISATVLTCFALPIVGFYDGIFGPGAGSFYMLMLLGLGGMGVLQATAQTKLFNFASNLGGFIGFALIGAVAWKIGLAMAAGQIVGSSLGARMAMKKGAKLIRPLLVLICIATAVKLLVFG
jgi:uncharacterized membrane protein YfcA